MNKEFFSGNRSRFLNAMEPRTLAAFFSDREIRKSADANYLFYANRNFVYLTGIEQKESVLLMGKTEEGEVWERLYLLPKDLLAERWTGRRLTGEEAFAISGVRDVRSAVSFREELEGLLKEYSGLYLDLHKQDPSDIDRPAHSLAKDLVDVTVLDGNSIVRHLRTIKQPCEIEALRKEYEAILKTIRRLGTLKCGTLRRLGQYCFV